MVKRVMKANLFETTHDIKITTVWLIDVPYPAEIAKSMLCQLMEKKFEMLASNHQTMKLLSRDCSPKFEPPTKKKRQNAEEHHPRRSVLAVCLQHQLQQVSQLLRCGEKH